MTCLRSFAYLFCVTGNISFLLVVMGWRDFHNSGASDFEEVSDERILEKARAKFFIARLLAPYRYDANYGWVFSGLASNDAKEMRRSIEFFNFIFPQKSTPNLAELIWIERYVGKDVANEKISKMVVTDPNSLRGVNIGKIFPDFSLE